MKKQSASSEVMIADLTIETHEELKLKYEALMAKEESRLKEEDILADENIGHFWGILETRPYMRLRHAYLTLLLSSGKYRKAIRECEDLLMLCEGDNLGVRYILISIYAFFEDEINAIRLCEKFEKEESAHMLLPMAALYYKLDEYKKAETYLEKLSAVNEGLKDIFCDTDGAGAYRCGNGSDDRFRNV